MNGFHPAVATWFLETFDRPTPPQAQGWPSIQARQHTLIAAPTGSGKTLAAFLSAIDDLVRQGLRGALAPGTQVVYISPLKALGNDVEKNLQAPLRGIAGTLQELGLPAVDIRTAVRSGDTTSTRRAAQVKRPPHILVTTPESLYILLTSQGGRRMLGGVRTVIVDEIHAMAPNRRGSHLSLTLERLRRLVGGDLVRIGLSATQKPIDRVANFLTGGEPCTIVDSGHARQIDLQIETTGSPLEAVMSAEHMVEIYDRLAYLIRTHTTTLIFTNTRREAERVTKNLCDRLEDGAVGAHHGSLAKERRLEAEQALKSGRLRALVATASLELGIDIGSVDLVCQMGSVRTIGTALQRIGRSGHQVGAIPRGRLFPLTRDELVESVALMDAIERGELDALEIPEAPLDILAQQLVAMSACEEWSEAEMFAAVRGAWPYRNLSRQRFDDVVAMLGDGFSTRRGRRGAYLHRDEVNGRVRGRKSARLTAITSGGAIPDRADYRVILDPTETFVGTLDEDFAIESMPGDIFQLGNTSWQIARIENGTVRVTDARGAPPTLPFWFGEAPSRSAELSAAVARLRDVVAAEIDDKAALENRLVAQTSGARTAVREVIDYLGEAFQTLGSMPSQDTIVVERFFDEAGNMHLVLHSPFGSRLNRAWGLALRKRFCKAFNFELQAAASEDAIILSLGPTHSFPLEDVFKFLSSGTVRGVLVQALLDAPMFITRWRWNLNRSLAVPRFRGGKKIPPPIQRMEAEDLLAVAFPDQLACLENIVGEREVPDQPIVQQTIDDCLREAMDIDGLEALLRRIEAGEVRLVAKDVREPSVLAHQILNARPYAFLDPAPLEERRTQAVLTRRGLDGASAGDLGALDQAAIDRVRAQAWPAAETADELHDTLVVHGFLTQEEGLAGDWLGLFEALCDADRAAVATVAPGASLWVAAERVPQLRTVFPEVEIEPAVVAPARHRDRAWTQADAERDLLRGRLDAVGPTTAALLARSLRIPETRATAALYAMEQEGSVFRGCFEAGLGAEQWCERRLLARIHRYTLNRLRQEISPVTPADYMRFLFAWQRVEPSEAAAGAEGLQAVLDQLQGFHAAAASWESDILPSRVRGYQPSLLDQLAMSGQVVWGRFKSGGGGLKRPLRSSPVAFVLREDAPVWLAAGATQGPGPDDEPLSAGAQRVFDLLESRGACFAGELARGGRLLQAQVETALAELVAAGAVTSDSFTGLRALLLPANRRPRPQRGGRRSARSMYGVEGAGRWSLLARESAGDAMDEEDLVGTIAWALLRRWGVVFRKVLFREQDLPPWRDLLYAYRRMEARGEIRGGRFVSGFVGEQFALMEAVGKLRSVRRSEPDGQWHAVCGSDPLNLTGVVTVGERVPSLTTNRVLYRDGVPVAVFDAGQARFLVEVPDHERRQAQRALIQRPAPLAAQAYLG